MSRSAGTGPDLSRRYFFNTFIKNQNKKQCEIITEIESFATKNGVFEESKAKSFVPKVIALWYKSSRNYTQMERRHSEYLSANLYNPRENRSEGEPQVRPAVKPFSACSESQKRRRTVEMRKEDSDALLFSAASGLRTDGKREMSQVIDAISKTPTLASDILEFLKNLDTLSNQPKEISSDKALAIFLDCGLTKERYLRLRRNFLDQATHQIPSYEKLKEAKRQCYPENVDIQEVEAVVELQNLLDHTATRLMTTLSGNVEKEELIMYYKWGFDGSAGHGQYKQVFQSESSTDATVLITTIVPLRVSTTDHSTILWENKTPSSTRFCRPIRIAYEKETVENVKKEANRVMAQISKLKPTTVQLNGKSVKVRHELILTMVDGKIINILEENKASSRCYICDSGQKDMNDLSKHREIHTNRLKYGISPLHARIKFFEYLLRLSYRLGLPKKLRPKSTRLNAENKEILKAKKMEIQQAFKSQLGLTVDTPKPGFGSTNDGNTSRKFFEKRDISSAIIGIDKRILERMHVILIAINIFQEIDPAKFRTFALETANMLDKEFGFWPMSPTVHKVLLHGDEIIAHAILPTGLLSEEAMEHRNKDFKTCRQSFSRQMSRTDNLTDIFNRFLLTSDPYINSLRSAPPKSNKMELPVEVQNMLKT